MLLLSPEIVRFESHAWDDAIALAVDHIPKRTIEDHSDLGPFATFADVPEHSIHIRVQRRITNDDTDGPSLGDSGQLIFYTGQITSPLTRQRITITCTLIAIRSDLPTAKPPTRTLTFIATSPTATTPISSAPAQPNE